MPFTANIAVKEEVIVAAILIAFFCIYTPADVYCCDRKSRAACAQRFAVWQQATIEFTRRDHSVTACSRHLHLFLFFAHIPFVVNHTINATPPERLQQYQHTSNRSRVATLLDNDLRSRSTKHARI